VSTFIPVPDVCQIGMQMVVQTQPVSIVLHALHSGAFTITNMQNLGKALLDGIDAEFGGPSIPATANTQLVNLRLTDLTTSTSPAIDWTTGTADDLPYTGTYGTAEQGAQVSTVVTWQTLNRGRSFRGRSYFPGVPQDKLVNADSVTSAWVIVMEGMWNSVKDAINTAEGGNWTMVVVSKFSEGAARAVGIATPVSSFRQNAKLGTQRRRLG